jgi:hypothetical protein
MRFLPVSANREQLPGPIFPLGLGYIAAAAQQAGHEVAVADLCFVRHPLRFLPRQIRTFHPEVVGLSIRNIDNAAYPLTVDYLDRHREAVTAMRDTTDAPLVPGGSGFSILPGSYMEALQSDRGIRGEGEQVFVMLLDALENGRSATGITGLLSRGRENVDDTGIMLLPERGPRWNDGLHPNRHRFDYPRYLSRGGLGNIQTKRGCVFKCGYCTYPLPEGNRFHSHEAGDAVLRRKNEILREVGCPRAA